MRFTTPFHSSVILSACPMDIRPIKNERDHENALRRVEELWDSPEGSTQSDELGILATLIDAYEREHHPIAAPTFTNPLLRTLDSI